MNTFADNSTALNKLQLELLKSLKYMASEKQISDVKSLLKYYFAQQLDLAIDEAESQNNYSAEIYNCWLNSNSDNNNQA